jgi:hypothetical protein
MLTCCTARRLLNAVCLHKHSRRTPRGATNAQVLDVIESLFMAIFDGLKSRYATELAAVQAQYPFTPIEAKPTRLTFEGAL